jgi:hypothetical protein
VHSSKYKWIDITKHWIHRIIPFYIWGNWSTERLKSHRRPQSRQVLGLKFESKSVWLINQHAFSRHLPGVKFYGWTIRGSQRSPTIKTTWFVV